MPQRFEKRTWNYRPFDPGRAVPLIERSRVACDAIKSRKATKREKLRRAQATSLRVRKSAVSLPAVTILAKE